MAEENGWLRRIAENPSHSQWYIQRFRDMAARGEDLAGEARLIDALVPRGARILDAGCGTGRVGGFLAAAGHDVVGVDLDPALITTARPVAEFDAGFLEPQPAPGPGPYRCAGDIGWTSTTGSSALPAA